MALRRLPVSSATSCTHGCSQPSLPHPPHSTVSGRHTTTSVIIAGVSVACAILFLLLTYYAVLIRRHRGEDLSSDGNSGASDSEEGEVGYAELHIRNTGLQESTTNSITAKPCVAGARSATSCSVCLNDFREGELVRLLPSCGHCFHVLCIDTWLRAHVSCPLCRANVFDSISVFPSREEIVGSIASEATVQTSDHRFTEASEEDARVTVTDTVVDNIESSTNRDPGDLPGNLSRQECRSNSMGSFLESDLTFRTDREESSENGTNLNKEKGGIRLTERHLQKNTELGGGSTSNSGRFFFFSRHGRSRSSSVLPL